jgi:cytochrome c peroxidase
MGALSNRRVRRFDLACGFTGSSPYFHNGSAPTLDAVVATYNARQVLGLDAAQANDLVEYLKSL